MRYLEGEEISDEEIMKCLIKGIRQAIIYPMLCGSAYKNIGLGRLMNAIIDFTYPAILNDYIVMDKETGEEDERYLFGLYRFFERFKRVFEGGLCNRRRISLETAGIC